MEEGLISPSQRLKGRAEHWKGLGLGVSIGFRSSIEMHRVKVRELRTQQGLKKWQLHILVG